MDLETAKQQIGKNVRKYRLELNLTQTDLAIAAGLHENYISKVERGIMNVTLESMIRIAKALRIDLEKLVDGIYDHPDVREQAELVEPDRIVLG